MPPADFNVFKAATEFRYILRDELRINPGKSGKRSGFDEAKLSDIRKYYGVEAFFSSVEEFRNAIEKKKIKVYKHPFMKDKKPVGIPQGLPISAVLANLYLLNFDRSVLKEMTDTYGGYYRRYSDDIMVICKPEHANEIEKFVLTEIQKSKVKISEEKTEKFRFEHVQISTRVNRLTSILLKKNGDEVVGKPLTYLGFEFYGYKTLIKSANIAKFYRRMIYAVKRHAHRANSIYTHGQPAIFPRQLRKLYTNVDLRKEKKKPEFKVLRKGDTGYFGYKKITSKSKPKSRTNYFSYSRRASEIMNEPQILEQLNKHRSVFHSAMFNHLNHKRMS